MTQTFVVRTTGFSRSEYDDGFELFAIDLDKTEVDRLLGLIRRAKQLAKLDPEFQYLTLKDEAGQWLSQESVPKDILDRMQEAHEQDADLVLKIGSPVGEVSFPDRRQELFVKPDAVFWGCINAANDADWLIDTTEISEAKLKRLAETLATPAPCKCEEARIGTNQ